jgi:hypothetical protein
VWTCSDANLIQAAMPTATATPIPTLIFTLHFIPNSHAATVGHRPQRDKQYPNVHVIKPVALGGSLGYYGGEDMDEKSSMMAHSDVLATVYSTMVVETAVHDTPIVAAVIDIPGGWNIPKKFSLSLKKIGNWPTHKRFRDAKAGRVAQTESELRDILNSYLKNPQLDTAERKRFIEDEITFTDGTSGQKTAEFILNVLEKSNR